MRSFLVPAILVLLGLAVMASPPFIPLRLDPGAMPEGPGGVPALHAGSAGIFILGLSIAATGLLLGHRRYLLRHAGDTRGRERRITTATAFLAGIALHSAATLALLSLAAEPAFALSLGEMAQEAGEDLEVVPFFISVAFYILGILIFGFGMIRLKRHMDQPAQTTIGSGLVAVLIGVAFLVAPSVINAVGETFGVDATATLSRPALD